jgi:hypothetical protein
MAPTQVYILKVKVPVTQKLTTALAASDFMASTDAKTKFAQGVAKGLSTASFTFTEDMIEITGASDGSRRMRRGLAASVLSVNYDVVLEKSSSGVDGADATVQSNFATSVKASTLQMVNALLIAPNLVNALTNAMASATKADGSAIVITKIEAPPPVLLSAVKSVEFGNPSQAPTAAPAAAADDDEGMSGAIVGAIIAVAVLIIGGGAYSFLKSPSDKKVLPSSLDE